MSELRDSCVSCRIVNLWICPSLTAMLCGIESLLVCWRNMRFSLSHPCLQYSSLTATDRGLISALSFNVIRRCYVPGMPCSSPLTRRDVWLRTAVKSTNTSLYELKETNRQEFTSLKRRQTTNKTVDFCGVWSRSREKVLVKTLHDMTQTLTSPTVYALVIIVKCQLTVALFFLRQQNYSNVYLGVRQCEMTKCKYCALCRASPISQLSSCLFSDGCELLMLLCTCIAEMLGRHWWDFTLAGPRLVRWGPRVERASSTPRWLAHLTFVHMLVRLSNVLTLETCTAVWF